MKPPSLDLPLALDDGRLLLVRAGQDQYMVCRQKTGDPLEVGDKVRGLPGRDGRKVAMMVIKRTKKDVTFHIIGSCDGETVNLRWIALEVWAWVRRVLYWFHQPKRMR